MKRNPLKIVPVMIILITISSGCAAISSMFGEKPLPQDDFSNSDSGWGVGTDSDRSIEYSDGVLHMQVFTQNYFVRTTPDVFEYENVHIEVTAKNNGTDSTTAFGIFCNEQSAGDSFHYFAVTPAGEYAIVKAATGQTYVFLTNDDQWALSDLIAPDAASYRLSADCGIDALTLYVDGKQIASVSDSSYTRGRVGLFTWSGVDATKTDVSFDDFVMTKLGQQ